MTERVTAQIPVTREAALFLRDAARAERVGALLSQLLKPAIPATDPLAAIIRELKFEVHAAGLTDAEIDAELAAHNAERRV